MSLSRLEEDIEKAFLNRGSCFRAKAGINLSPFRLLNEDKTLHTLPDSPWILVPYIMMSTETEREEFAESCLAYTTV